MTNLDSLQENLQGGQAKRCGHCSWLTLRSALSGAAAAPGREGGAQSTDLRGWPRRGAPAAAAFSVLPRFALSWYASSCARLRGAGVLLPLPPRLSKFGQNS